MSPSAYRRRMSRKTHVFCTSTAAAIAASGALVIVGSAQGGKAPQPAPAEPVVAETTRSTAFTPYVDTSLTPAYDMLDTLEKTGVKTFNLAFITSGGGCEPKWGGFGDLGGDPVAERIPEVRKAGGDVRVSFGGAGGTELGVACDSTDALAAAYGKVVDAYRLTKVDFDIEGDALSDTEANTRRARAVARLQEEYPGLDVSFTLPVTPDGLTPDGVGLVKNAKENGVEISAVNIVATDPGTSYSGGAGGYAVDAATATQTQLKKALELDDTAAWRTVAVTSAVGANGVPSEVFKVDDAERLVKFAETKHLGRLSTRSATACGGDAWDSTRHMCDSAEREPTDLTKLTKAFVVYKG